MGSSSSDDSVRSITAGAGRLALFRGAVEEWSLPPELGVSVEWPSFLGVSNRRPPIMISDTSKSSSSSSSSGAPRGLTGDESSLGGLLDHLPFGSIVTVSRFFDVLSKIALT
jgi:hypothetical protein